MSLLRRHRSLWLALTAAISLTLVGQPYAAYACALAEAQAYQPFYGEVSLAIERAALSQLGTGYPTLPLLEMGPEAKAVAAPVPCVLLKAIGYVEGSWRQAFGSVAAGSTGVAKQSASCGYGIMQITSGMRNPGELPEDTQQRIASDYRYNIGWGAKVLAEKWNVGDFQNAVVGVRDPSVAEHWYYAVWAYNQFNFKNNPNNPDYPWPRPAFDGTQSRLNYPYQELVWGYAAHPPVADGASLWEAVAVALPSREAVGMTPGPLPPPAAAHSAACRTLYADPGLLSLQAGIGAGPLTQQHTLYSATGPGPFTWRAEASGGTWLRVSPSSGTTLPAQVAVTVDPRQLSLGTYRGQVAFTGASGVTPTTLQVELRVEGGSRWFFPYLPRRALGSAQQ